MGSHEHRQATRVIMGVDPGLRVTGYGIMEAVASALRVITAGDIRPTAGEPLARRLACIHEGLSTLIVRHRPHVVVLEQLFTHHHHVTTAALMAHARGMACLAAEEHGLPVAEYPCTHVKRSLTGSGSASKEQVARMVGQWLRWTEPSWSMDATDALALAIVHAQGEAQRRRLPVGV